VTSLLASTRRPASRATGFTLVEVLVAMLVMAVMAVMAWQGVDGITRSRNVSQDRLEQTLRLDTVLAQWEQDLTALQDSRTVPALLVQGRTMLLTRRTDSGLQVVAWALRGGAWWRWAGPAATTVRELQDSWFASQQLIGTETGQVRMLDGANSWEIYFFRGNAWSNAQSTGDVDEAAPPTTPAQPRQQLPQGVRLVLDLTDGSAPVTLTRDIALAPQLP
jgi:general secretion pathway protein J